MHHLQVKRQFLRSLTAWSRICGGSFTALVYTFSMFRACRRKTVSSFGSEQSAIENGAVSLNTRTARVEQKTRTEMLTNIARLNRQLDLAPVFSWASSHSDDLAQLKCLQPWDKAGILNHFIFIRNPNDALHHSRAVIHYHSERRPVNWKTNTQAPRDANYILTGVDDG